MAENRDAGVDPRFDPVFQRGYDPTVHGSRRVRDTAPATGLRPVASTSAAVPPEPETARREVTVPEVTVPEVDEPEVTVPEVDEPERVNPFRLALLLASVAAIGGAALMLWLQIDEAAGTFPSPYDVEELFAEQFTDALLVPLLAGGLIGLSLWLALGAVGRSRRD